MPKTLQDRSNEVNQPPIPSISGLKGKSERSPSPKQSLDMTRTSTAPSKCAPIMKLNVDNPVVNTDNDVLERTSTFADQPERGEPHYYHKVSDAVINERCVQEKHHKNENRYVLNKCSY